MYYSVIAFAALLFSVQFVFNNGFQRENGNGLPQTLSFSLYTSVFGLIFLFVINKFTMEISLFSLVVATVYAIVVVLLNYCSIQAFSYANLSVYSVFSMIGGMILPFLYGMFAGEKITLIRTLCLMLITFSILLTATDGKHSLKAMKYYILVFFLNGLVAVLSSFHQSFETLCVDSSSFLILTKIVSVVICMVFILINKNNRISLNKKSLSMCFGSAALNSLGNLLLLLALLHLPASLQYPMVTGGTIVFSTIIDKIRKVKLSRKEIAAAVVALVSSILMAF